LSWRECQVSIENNAEKRNDHSGPDPESTSPGFILYYLDSGFRRNGLEGGSDVSTHPRVTVNVGEGVYSAFCVTSLTFPQKPILSSLMITSPVIP
jgi:hypothetical protein